MSAHAKVFLHPTFRWLTGVALMLIIYAPFLVDWGNWMWGREHYQFFPLIIAGFSWLVYQRLQTANWPSVPAFSVRVGLYLSLAVLMLFVAVKTQSHWIGLISCIASLWATVWYFGGKVIADELRGPFWFLSLLVPLPLNLDLKCITDLQHVAAWLASGALDLRGLRHTVSGVAIRTLSKGYMVEEACSGVHSLFSAVSAMTFFGVYFRYGLPRLFVIAVQTLFWVLVANAVRVFLIVYVDTRWQVALDTGWMHDVLGIATYGFILLFAISTDQLLLFVFPMSQSAIQDASRDFLEPVFRPLNRFVHAVFDRPALSGSGSLFLGILTIVICYLPLAGFATASLLRRTAELSEGLLTGVPLQQILSEDSAEPAWNAWIRKEFRNDSRRPGDPFGTESAIWLFQGNGLDVQLSVDAWFPSWHDLTYCYQGIGWKLQQAANEEVLVSEKLIPHTRLSLYKNTPAYATVLFTCFDSTATAIQPPEVTGSLLRTLRDRLLTLGRPSESDMAIRPPVFQIQMLVESDRELQPDELQLVQDFFVLFRAHMVGQLVTGL